MPLAATFGGMKSVIEGFTLDNDFHAGENWAKVAEAFFSQGVSPTWTDTSAGKGAFAGVMGPALPPTPAGVLTFGLAWQAFALTCAASCAPGAPLIAPVVPPPAPPVFTNPGGAADVDAMVTQLLADLLIWTATGMQTVPPPAGGTAPPWT